MRYLILSPLIVDHSFPRDRSDMSLAQASVASIYELCDSNSSVRVLLTEQFVEFLSETDWSNRSSGALLAEIIGLINRMVLRGLAVTRPIPNYPSYICHAAPRHCSEGMLIIWEDEVGRLFAHHLACIGNNEFAIGIACDHAFCAECSCMPVQKDNEFPIVGPKDLSLLCDAEEWVVPSHTRLGTISVDEAEKNIRALRPQRMKPLNSSHRSIYFAGGSRPWVLDRNVDPVPHTFLLQLVPLTGLPIDVIYFVLKNGHFPEKRNRLGW
jgi:hypothetical protein